MCLIMTAIFSAAAAAIWFFLKKNGREIKSLFFVALMFFSAALMWCVDGVASLIEGNAFFDMSAEDAILGGIILALGLFIFAFLFLIEKAKCKKRL